MARSTPLAISTLAAVATLACSSPYLTDTRASGMRVTVQKFVPALGCFATVTPDVPVDDALGLPPPCPESAPPRFLGASDRVRLVIDYGDVQFDETAVVPAPTLHVTLDGAETPSGATFEEPARKNGHAVYLATFVAPGRRVMEMRISVDAGSGFGTTVSTAFAVDPPQVEIAVQQCVGATPCTMASGVGSAVVQVTTPGVLAQTATLTWTIDGVLDPQSRPVAVNVPMELSMCGTAFVDVPVAHDRAVWTLSAQLGTTVQSTPPITLVAPIIGLQAQCGVPCTAAAGGTLPITVTAPLAIRTRQALVSATLNGVPQLANATVSFTTDDTAAGTTAGTLALPVPAAAATWVIDASVNGFHAPSLVVGITP